MNSKIQEEYEAVIKKRDEVREILKGLEAEDPKDSYNIRINRDRLAYWEGRSEGLEFALKHLSSDRG